MHLKGFGITQNYSRAYYWGLSSKLYGEKKSELIIKKSRYKISKEEKINVATDQISNPTYVADLVQFISDSILLDSLGIFHFGSADKLSRYEFANSIADVFDLDAQLINSVNIKELSFIAKRPKNSSLSIDKTMNELGVSPYTIEHCLCKMKESAIIV